LSVKAAEDGDSSCWRLMPGDGGAQGRRN
jgi:hypothetical protein